MYGGVSGIGRLASSHPYTSYNRATIYYYGIILFEYYGVIDHLRVVSTNARRFSRHPIIDKKLTNEWRRTPRSNPTRSCRPPVPLALGAAPKKY